MGLVLEALFGLFVAGRPRRRDADRAPRPHPVPAGFWRDFVNGLLYGFALVMLVASAALCWITWGMLNDDMLSILGIILFPFAAAGLAAAIGLAAHAVSFSRRT